MSLQHQLIILALLQCAAADFEHLTSKPEIIILPRSFETLLKCEMNIEPDRFQWKFYPTSDPHSLHNINLINATYRLIPESSYNVNKKKAELNVQVREDTCGDYQCLAYYGASVVASVPWKVTMAFMGPIADKRDIKLSVKEGNTVNWRCDVPRSTPEAYVEFYKDTNNKYVTPQTNQSISLTLPNVTIYDSGTYKCEAYNTFERKYLNSLLYLEVVRHALQEPPRFITPPINEYTAVKGQTLYMQCGAVGNPIPKVTWYKKHPPLPQDRMEMVPGGLLLKNVTSKDDGLYVCNFTNPLGAVWQEIVVRYNEEPSIDCFLNTTDIKQGENMDIECDVRGTPDPQLAWFLNGFSVLNDSRVEAVGNKIYFRRIEKKHAGNLQIFARNVVNTVYSSISIRVIPLTSSMDEMPVTAANNPRRKYKKSQHNRHSSKHKGQNQKMTPPSKPVISRVNDHTVVVRWNVSYVDNLDILCFKVQYKEVSSSPNKKWEWETISEDIQATITTYEISNLNTSHFYKFRIAAVYSNDDSIMSPTSKKFHLQKMDFEKKNPLPTCLINKTQTVNHTAIKIYWECPPYNVTIDGFYINYIMDTQAGDYTISTVEGGDVRSFVVNYLTAETGYEFKLQSFNQKMAGELSYVMKGRTSAQPPPSSTTQAPSTVTTKKSVKPTTAEPNSRPNIYIIIVGVVIGFAFVLTGVILLFVCRKWKKQKLSAPASQNKPQVDHHIQAESNDYVVEPKPRTNGCGHITITSNPLAEADKNPTTGGVIELSQLANNNEDTPPVHAHSTSRGGK